MNLIDVDTLKEKEQYIPCGNNLLFHGVTAATIDAMPAVDPENLPIVQQLRAEVANLKDQLQNLEYWQLNRKIVLESAVQDRAAMKVMRKRCEKTIAELRAELARTKKELEESRADSPIWRCKDCASKEKAAVNAKGFLVCPASGMEITDDDFCSYFKPKGENENEV